MRTTIRAALALVALVTVACGGTPTSSTGDTPGGGQSTTATAPTASTGPGGGGSAGTSSTAVPVTLDFTAPGVTGGEVRGADVAGGAVALWFWAPW